ncbi:MAG: hypothetical protein V1788_03130 [Nanoarchaeota archaeon]|nr:hypothetical protein [Nanoarchaeota archaeon]
MKYNTDKQPGRYIQIIDPSIGTIAKDFRKSLINILGVGEELAYDIENLDFIEGPVDFSDAGEGAFVLGYASGNTLEKVKDRKISKLIKKSGFKLSGTYKL